MNNPSIKYRIREVTGELASKFYIEHSIYDPKPNEWTVWREVSGPHMSLSHAKSIIDYWTFVPRTIYHTYP